MRARPLRRRSLKPYMLSHSSLLVKLAYGKARLIKPRRTTPHPLPKAHAERTYEATCPAGRWWPRKMIRFAVTRALNRTMMGGVATPDVCKCGWTGPEREADAEELFKRKRQMVMDIYRSWHLSNNNESAVVCSRQALEAWMVRHLVKPSDRKTTIINEGEGMLNLGDVRS